MFLREREMESAIRRLSELLVGNFSKASASRIEIQIALEIVKTKRVTGFPLLSERDSDKDYLTKYRQMPKSRLNATG